MKRLFYILSAAVTLASCSDDETFDKNGRGSAIEFGELNTRAQVNDASQILEFGVFAKMNLGGDDTPEAGQYIDLLENERVYRADASSEWSYDNKRYWVDGRTFHFFAVYPYMSRTGKVTAATLNQNGYEYDGYKIVFETPSTADTDLMTAYRTVNIPATPATDYIYPIVDFSGDYAFRHALSKINIKVAKNSNNEANKVEVTSISLSGIWKTGTLNTSRFQEYKDNWDFSGSATMSITKTGSWILDTDGVEFMGEGLLLMPQTIGLEKIPVTISYSYYNNEADTTPQKRATVQAFLTVGEWEPAKHYTYTIVLSAEDNKIKFTTPTVEPWGSLQSGGTIIIQ